MKKTFQQMMSFLLVFSFLLAACQTGNNINTSLQQPVTDVRVAAMNVDNMNQQVGEVLVNNNNTVVWRGGMQQFFEMGGKVDIFIDCADGRCNAGSMQYTVFTAQGQQELYRFEIGSLAGHITPEMVAVFNTLIDQSRVRSINVSTHTSCEGGTCGAQGVKFELEAGKPVSEFSQHGVGDAAQWINDNLNSSHPIDQVAAQVTKVFEGTGARVPVFGWLSDHGTQVRELIAERYTGRPDENIIVSELRFQNQESARILGPLAESQGLPQSQSFRRIVVTDSLIPVEKLVGTPSGTLDEAFNVSFIVPPNATPEQIQSALGPVRAGLQYALAHATPETEFFLMFRDQDLMAVTLDALQPLQVYQDFLAATEFQEVAAYVLDDAGSIQASYLIKPAYSAVSVAKIIGPFFREQVVSDVIDLEGQKWALISGDPNSTSGGTWVSFSSTGGYRFARTYPLLADATFHYNAYLAEAQQTGLDPAKFRLAAWHEAGGVVYSDIDLGEPVLAYLRRTGNWWELDALVQAGEARALAMCQAGFCTKDWGIHQILRAPDGQVYLSDWSPYTTLTGKDIAAVFSTPTLYAESLRRGMDEYLSWRARNIPVQGLPAFINWGPLPELPPSWSFAGESAGFAGAGAANYMTAEQIAAFERAIADLRSTSPETVAAAKNTLRAMGAVEYQGQWIIGGSRSVLASGPLRFATLETMYPDGGKAFIGFQTRQFGVLGLERAENVPGGIAGWRMYAPKIFNSLEGKTIAGIPASQAFSKLLNNGLLLLWIGFAVDDLTDYATQTDHMALQANTSQLYEPPTQASHAIWFPAENWPHPTTSWSVSYEDLMSGCNGTGFTTRCGAYLEPGEEKPLLLYGALAGTTIPKTGFPSFGVEGNTILASWSYMRTEGGFVLWHENQTVFPGSTLDYYEFKVNEFGAWMIPYHAEFQTASCTGLCVQQSWGGEELLFEEGASPREVELCPATYDSTACWKP